MKKVVLSKMKCAALFAMMFFSYEGMAQNASLYIGDNCKIYPQPYEANYSVFDMTVAHLVTDEYNSSAKCHMADKLTFIKEESMNESKMRTITPEHGNFVEFYDVYKNMFIMFADVGCIIKIGSSLYLSNYDYNGGWKARTITTDLEIADDFQIIYYGKSNYTSEKRIYIKNNGILSEYCVYDLPYTSVNSPKVDETEDATYSLDGKKVQTPHNGIFIKGDKKVMIK